MNVLKLIALWVLALLPLAPEALAQFSVYDKDGNVLFSMPDTPAYVDFTYHQPASAPQFAPECVDLGLSSGTLWATCNVGATAPDEAGSFFAWAEVAAKDSYVWERYKWCNGSGFSLTKYCSSDKYGVVDNVTALDDVDDVAYQLWGNKWCTPTKEQQDELRNQCYWVWVSSYNGKSVSGFVVYKAKRRADKGVKLYVDATPSPDYDVAHDAHIFLPASGACYDSTSDHSGLYGYYWSRSLSSTVSSSAYCLNFLSGNASSFYYERNVGMSVRPVCRVVAE